THKGAGHIPRRVQGLLGGDGVVRYCGVWGKKENQPENWNISWVDFEPAYAGKVIEEEHLLLDVHVGQAGAPRPLRETWLVRLKQASAAKPGDLDALYQRATAQFHLGRDAEALKVLNAILAKGKYAPAYRHRALLHARAGRGEKRPGGVRQGQQQP